MNKKTTEEYKDHCAVTVLGWIMDNMDQVMEGIDEDKIIAGTSLTEAEVYMGLHMLEERGMIKEEQWDRQANYL